MSNGEPISEVVANAVEKAARDALADSGGISTGFVALITFLDSEGNRCWSLAYGEDQSLAQSLGMADILEMTVRAQVEAAFMAEPDGES